MFRTALLSAVTAAGFILPVATANAAPPVFVYPSGPGVYYPPAPVCRSWTVLYRGCNREPWRAYRSYSSAYGADRAAHHLRHHGFEVFVSVAG
jgi:hypothetical protein